MNRALAVLLPLLAWLCLAIPWQQCVDGCDGIAPLGTACHEHAAEHASCCGGDADGVQCGSADEHCVHCGLLLPQTLPDAPGEPAPAAPPPHDTPFALPALPEQRQRPVRSAVDPPGSVALVHRRTVVLLS